MSIFTCPICALCFSRNFNLKRHLYSKHDIKEDIDDKHHINGNEHHINGNEHHINGTYNCENIEKVLPEELKIHKCNKCNKTFSDNWRVTRHLKTCKGIVNKLECEYCKCTFKHVTSRYKHYKICKEKNKPYVTINNNTTNNNTTNTINSHNTNNNTVNLTIVYKIGDEMIDLNTEHFTENILKKILACKTNTESVQEYVKQAFANPENCFIKKNSLREPVSELHVGDNKWEYVLDKQVYPDLATGFANTMLEYIYTKKHALKRTAFEKLRDTLDCLADKGYINTDDRELKKRIENEFKLFVKNLKLIVLNIHRKT